MEAQSLVQTYKVNIRANSIILEGRFTVPEYPDGVIALGHGCESGYIRQQNCLIADVLNKAGLATLQFDLFTSDEETIGQQTQTS